MTPSDQLLYSTLKLTTYIQNNTATFGTGFLMAFPADDSAIIPAIITNKHVVDGVDEIKFRMSEMKNEMPSDQLLNFSVPLNGNVVHHPDKSVDLCAILIGPNLNDFSTTGRNPFYRFLSLELIPEEEDWDHFDSIEDIIMIGCPNGICDEVNNTPISRRGITATPPHRKYNGTNEFLIDMACFPGSSGSPIFLYNEHGYFDRRKNARIMGETRVKLLGILYQGPTITNHGNIIIGQEPRVETPSMMHLGHAIRSSELYAINDLLSNLPNGA